MTDQQPFDEKDVLWRWTPTADLKRVTPYDDVAQEYAIVSEKEANSGIVEWAKYRDKWDANPWSSRPIVAELLRQLKAAQEQVKSMEEQTKTQFNAVLDALNASNQKDKKIAALDEQLADADDAIGIRDNQIADLSKQLVKLRADYKLREQDIHSLNAALVQASNNWRLARTDASETRKELQARITELENELLLHKVFGPPKQGDPVAIRSGAADLREIEATMKTALTMKQRETLLRMADDFDNLVHEMLYWDGWQKKTEARITELEAELGMLKMGFKPAADTTDLSEEIERLRNLLRECLERTVVATTDPGDLPDLRDRIRAALTPPIASSAPPAATAPTEPVPAPDCRG